MNTDLSPRRLLLVLFCALSSVAAQSSDAARSQAIAEIRAELDRRAAAERFSGAVMIVSSGATVFEGAVGAADSKAGVPNSIQTRFRFGSIGKMFTAVAVLQLVHSGRVKLDDTVGVYLPDYPNREVAAVTVQQLLSHTGGTGDIFGPEFPSHRAALKTLSDYVQLYGKRGVEFQPGTQHRYSNYGFVLLGRIVEVASGRSYDQYVDEHVFAPAGMKMTGNAPENSAIAGLAVPYTRGPPGGAVGRGPGPGSEQPLRSAIELLPYRGTAAGGGYSTVGDLARFAGALASGSVLDPGMVATATAGKVAGPRPGLRYGFGFEEVTAASGSRRYGHGGGAPGMNGVLWIYPDAQLVIAVLANLDPPAADEVARFIEQRLGGVYLPR